jgi:O-antigen ligase
VLKDVIYFTRPITILFASYFVVKRIHSQTYVFNTVILIALFFALKHLWNILININFIDSYVYLRTLGGKQNHIEIVALIILFFTPFHERFKKHRKLVIIIILSSFILYLSRTMYITLFIFFLGYKGYLFLNKKLIKGLFVLTSLVILIGVTFSNIETNRDSKGIKAFIYKSQNSFVELFETVDTNYILRDKRSLWEHWRAYEAQKAIEQLNENGAKAWLIGMGYGPPIELDTEVRLDGKLFTKVPSIHNGFIYVLFKTGIIGLLFYIIFIVYVFITFQKFRLNQSNSIFNKLLVSTSIYMVLNSFVITGFFRPGEFSVFFLGVLIASKYKHENNIRPAKSIAK